MSCDPADPIGSVFSEIIGKPAWLVRRGYGTFLTMEFGEPHLQIREPREAAPDDTEAVRRQYARRLVTVHGQWHLWVYCCDWKISRGSERIARNSSRDASIQQGAEELNGQILTAVEVDPLTAATRFLFDLGGTLQTKRWKNEKERYEQWFLYTPSGVLSLRDDARYSWQSESTTPNDEIWLPLPGV